MIDKKIIQMIRPCYYEECSVLYREDMTDFFSMYKNNKITLVLKDYTARGRNLIFPSPHFVEFYSKYPYWVQISDEDDWVGQKEFMFLETAKDLFWKIVRRRIYPMDIYKLLDF